MRLWSYSKRPRTPAFNTLVTTRDHSCNVVAAVFLRDELDDASASKESGLGVTDSGVMPHWGAEVVGRWHARNRVSGAGVIFAKSVKLVKFNFTSGGTIMTLHEKHEERPAGYAAKMLRRGEPRRVRVKVVNRWSNRLLVIPRLRIE